MVWLELSRSVFINLLNLADDFLAFINLEITVPALPPFWESAIDYSVLDLIFGPGVFLVLLIAIVYHFLP